MLAITPTEIIKTVTTPEMIKNIPMNSLEGYIRQVIGWREFSRIYQNFDKEQSSSNFWSVNSMTTGTLEKPVFLPLMTP